MDELTGSRQASEQSEQAAQEGAVDALLGFIEYLDKRSDELEGALTCDNLDSWDPCVKGFATGTKTGLRIAQDLLYSYLEWVKRRIYFPDEVGPEK